MRSLNNKVEGIYKFQLKLGRNTFILDENDLLLDNLGCYQLKTQKYFTIKGFKIPCMHKTLFQQLLKNGLLLKAKESDFLITQRGLRVEEYTIYCFNAKVMSKLPKYAVE